MFSAAYVDESYDLNIGVYTLTASIIDLADAEEARYVLRSLQQGGQKLHWRKEPWHRRNEIVKAVSAFGSTSTSVVGTAAPLYTERARRKCMERLLPELEQAGVDTVNFEARQARNDKHDIDMVDACRRKKLITQGLHVTFALGMSEPLLWLADVVCGSVLAAQRGDGGYLEQLRGTTQLVRIEVS